MTIDPADRFAFEDFTSTITCTWTREETELELNRIAERVDHPRRGDSVSRSGVGWGAPSRLCRAGGGSASDLPGRRATHGSASRRSCVVFDDRLRAAWKDVPIEDIELRELELVRGRAEFDIRPGGPRRWRIDAGACEVEVLGTSFVVDRRTDGVHVAVSRGHVAVRSASLEGGLVYLTAGQSLDVSGLGTTSADLGEVGERGSSDGLGAAPAVVEATTVAVVESPPVPRAPEALSTSARRPGGGEALLVEAEAARTAGRPWDAAPLLRRFVTENPRDVGAARAAFSLARMELDQLGHPDRAADAFSRALALGLGGDLAQIARARRVEALHAAGDHDGAARAARDYFAHHPEGEWAREVRAWSFAGP
jgi:hypothetical protein